MLKQEIKNIKADSNDLVKFGLSFGGVLLLLGMVITLLSDKYFIETIAPYLFGSGGIVLILGILKVRILKGFYKVWMTIALILGWIMSHLIISFVFYLAVFPISLLAKLFGKNFLELGFKKNVTTYWNDRKKSSLNSNIEKQY